MFSIPFYKSLLGIAPPDPAEVELPDVYSLYAKTPIPTVPTTPAVIRAYR